MNVITSELIVDWIGLESNASCCEHGMKAVWTFAVLFCNRLWRWSIASFWESGNAVAARAHLAAANVGLRISRGLRTRPNPRVWMQSKPSLWTGGMDWHRFVATFLYSVFEGYFLVLVINLICVCVCVLLLVSFNLRMTEMVCVCTISSVIIFFLSNVCVRVAHSPKNVFSLYSLFICLSVCLFVCRPAGWLAGWFVCLFVWICGRGIHLLGWVGW